ncbi:MAG: antitoxin Xre/MbcA/ParS toxin-binding domain-containing protein [Bacteroidota bacterium]
MKKQEKVLSKLEEPAVAYGGNYSPLTAMIEGEYTNLTDFDLLSLIRKGVSKRSLLALAKQISLTIEELAVVLHISERTLQRYTPGTLVKAAPTDRAIELARLYERGAEVMGSAKAFNSWMRSPNQALNDEIPLNLLDTSIGFDLILQVLGRIEYGIFS